MSHPSTAAPRRAAPPWAGELPPKKVAWLHPVQLLRTAYHAWISAHAQELLDRRETLAALDRSDRPDIQAGPRGCVTDAASDLRHGSILTAQPTSERASGLWIDYVADVGDSWEATYAVAALLAAPHLQVRGWPHPLPSADIVVLGGDLVYPTATREGYRSRLRWPLASAYPEATRDPAPCLLAVPGNHDWYDGLNNFVREFCQGGFLGGWRLVQHRSYFAVKLIEGWWLWGIDIALDTRIDPPQQAYFLDVLKTRSPGDKIILCTAKPSWLDDPRYSDDAYRNLTYFVTQVIEKHGGSVPIILAGDLHHYSRYENAQKEQLIVAGGGGAYLNGTHHLPLRIEDLRSTSDGGRQTEPSHTDKFFVASDCSYPRRYESRRLAFGAVLLAFRIANWPFCLFVGLLYWLLAWPLRRALPPLAAGPFPEIFTVLAENVAQVRARVLIAAILMVMTCVGFSVLANRGPRLALAIWGTAAAFAHMITALLLACLVSPGSAIALRMTSLLGRYDELAPYFLSVLFVLVGGLAGGTLFGLYLVLSDVVAGLHRNEVFASQSIIDYRSFLRLYIGTDGCVRVFPIGLRRVPRKWRARPGPGATPQPEPQPVNPETSTRSPRPSQQHPLSRYEPADDVLAPHLIEGPIEIPKSS